MNENLQGAVAIVTGAANGMGLAIVREYARQGMKLALMDVQGDRLQAVADEINAAGGDALAIQVDLSDAADTERAIQVALNHYGTPRVLIHNAALLIQRSMLEITLEQWQKETNIILQAGFQLCKAVWQPMIDAGGGSIMLITSGSGTRGFVKEIAYCPAKHAIEGLTKTLAMEGAEFNIAVNAVTPGAPIKTPMSDQNYDDKSRANWVDPELITPTFVHLAKQDASGITGKRLAARIGTWEIIS
jgi:NAD(P)-dependent dehydrogenase (short-subunit alcohol dehydrogenase family)